MNEKRKCRKCGEYIPSRVTIEGKTCHLSNRKFCLKCSPYKGHNTKSDDPNRISKNGYFSNYKNWDENKKLLHRARVYKKGLDRKTILIELSGGKCQKCGYDKCNRALTFHHKNPLEKKFALCLNELWSKSLEEILKEWEKCELLCMNCHAEIENSKAEITVNSYKNIIDELSLKKETILYSKICPVCKKEFKTDSNKRIYCSQICFKFNYRKVERPSKEILIDLIKNNSLVKIGKMYSVSNTTIKKWAIKYNIDIKNIKSI